MKVDIMELINGIMLGIVFLCIFALPIGLVIPKMVILWGKNRNRKKVIKYYGLGFFVALIIGGLTAPKNEELDNLRQTDEYQVLYDERELLRSEVAELELKNQQSKQKNIKLVLDYEDIETQIKILKENKIILQNEQTIIQTELEQVEEKLEDIQMSEVQTEQVKENAFLNNVLDKGKEIIGMGQVKEGEIETYIYINYGSTWRNFLDSNDRIKVYIDGEELYQLKRGDSRWYNFKLSEGKHNIKVKINGLWGNEKTVSIQVTPQNNIFVFGTEKRWDEINFWLEESYAFEEGTTKEAYLATILELSIFE